jgi:hypothetical protein
MGKAWFSKKMMHVSSSRARAALTRAATITPTFEETALKLMFVSKLTLGNIRLYQKDVGAQQYLRDGEPRTLQPIERENSKRIRNSRESKKPKVDTSPKTSPARNFSASGVKAKAVRLLEGIAAVHSFASATEDFRCCKGARRCQRLYSFGRYKERS